MALPPPPMPPAGGAPPPMPPGAGAGGPPPPPPGPDDDSGGGDNVVCTIVDNGDGSYTVYSGDEPAGDTGDMSDDDAGAMGPAGDMAAPAGQHTDGAGPTLKAVMDILKAHEASSGGQGTADQQFAAGFAGPGAGGAAGGPPGP